MVADRAVELAGAREIQIRNREMVRQVLDATKSVEPGAVDRVLAEGGVVQWPPDAKGESDSFALAKLEAIYRTPKIGKKEDDYYYLLVSRDWHWIGEDNGRVTVGASNLARPVPSSEVIWRRAR
jgi:hypothetical protein